MPKSKLSPDRVYNENLTVMSACLELAAGVIQEVMGDDAIANQLNGENQSVRDIQEMVAARLAKAFGA